MQFILSSFTETTFIFCGTLNNLPNCSGFKGCSDTAEPGKKQFEPSTIAKKPPLAVSSIHYSLSILEKKTK